MSKECEVLKSNERSEVKKQIYSPFPNFREEI